MHFIKGVTFGFMTPRGKYADHHAQASLKAMVEETGCDTVIFTLAALQDTAHSEFVDYKGNHMPTDDELLHMIALAKSLGQRIIIKPLVNCKNGTWRAHINFFDKEVVCEPKWCNWFASYTAYQLHYARLAQQVGAEILIVGCEMVQTERRADEWRTLIRAVRECYEGLISYNTDKYQEEQVSWWDEVDVISSSGYYPIDDWEAQLTRIQRVVEQYQKPFFFAEAGCPSREGSSMIPNDWEHKGVLSVEEQAIYYNVMFQACSKHDWIRGFGLWDWQSHVYEKSNGMMDDGYGIYGKPASQVVKKYFKL